MVGDSDPVAPVPDALAWELGPDATWTQVAGTIGISAQRRFQELAVERARRRREPESLRV